MRILFIVVVLALYSFPAFSQNSSWQPYTSVDGLFKVDVPGVFQTKIDSITTQIGTMAYHTFFYQDKKEGAENFIYMVSYVDYPQHSIHSDSSELIADFFKATMEEAAFSINGDLIYNNAIEMDGYPGYQWRINYQGNVGVIKTKAILKGNRYYAIQAATIKELSLNPAINRFMDSFQLL